jgi:D-3-phosphoglycerate dehydrogenase
MENIMVVYDGTDASRTLYELLSKRIETEKLPAEVRLFEIKRDSASGLSSGFGIREYRGSVEHLARHTGQTTMLLVHLAPVSKEVLQASPMLKFVGSERSSLPNVDVAQALSRGIHISYSAGRNIQTVAEFTVGLMLDVTRSISASSFMVKNGLWDIQLDRKPYAGIELGGHRIGLFGFGGIGRKVAELLRGFNVEVCFFDPLFEGEHPAARRVSQEELLTTCDIISIHARNDQNRCLLGTKEFAQIKPGAYLINTARGYLLDETALIRLLRSGRIRGAALDVYETEPLPADSPLLAMPQVVLCPHIGGLSEDMGPRSAAFIIEDVLHFLKGEPLAHEYLPA